MCCNEKKAKALKTLPIIQLRHSPGEWCQSSRRFRKCFPSESRPGPYITPEGLSLLLYLHSPVFFASRKVTIHTAIAETTNFSSISLTQTSVSSHIAFAAAFSNFYPILLQCLSLHATSALEFVIMSSNTQSTHTPQVQETEHSLRDLSIEDPIDAINSYQRYVAIRRYHDPNINGF